MGSRQPLKGTEKLTSQRAARENATKAGQLSYVGSSWGLPPLCAAQSLVSICRAEEAASSPTPPPKGHMHEGKPHQPRSRTTGTHVFRKVTSTSHGEKAEVENG